MKRKPSSPNFEELTPILIATWRKLLKLPIGPLDHLQTREFRSLVAAVQRLHEEKSLIERELLGAYILYDWVLHYAQGLSLFGELPILPRRVLDIGCGGAPFAVAALQSGATDALGVDFNALALKIAGELCGKFGYPLTLREADCSHTLPITDKWDLIILGYSLFEIAHNPEAYIERLLPHLSDQGYILIVEPSQFEENRRFLALRDKLVERNIPIQAPCIWKGACPALKHPKSNCYAQRPIELPYLQKEVQRSAGIHLGSLKMSYLILRNTPLPELTKPLYRIVSPPVKTLHGERFFLCGNEGQKTLGTSLKEHPKHSRAFHYLRRGDLISVEKATERKNDLEITEETFVNLNAPCDKPLPEV
jgi:SAM-dependent methyltransferase